MSIDNCKWYALHVRPNYELFVASRLKELGVEEYLPTRPCRSIPRRNRFADGLPLFPGYLFAFTDLDTGPRLYKVPGIVGLLGYGGIPAPISDHDIAAIRTIVESRLAVQCHPYFVAGQHIVLVAGPLSGVKGTFIASKKGGQLVVSLPLLNRSLAVPVLADWVAGDPDRDKTAFV